MKFLYELLRTYAKLLLGRGSMRSYAQFGEDAIVGAMARKKQGVYVDVGSFHPTLYSNTYALYKRGWRGIVIDPENEYAPLYAAIRPRDSFVACAVGPAGEGTYYSYQDRAYNSLIPAGESSPAAVRNLKPVRERTVPIRPLSDIVRAAGLGAIDFLSIDAEGMDLAILNTYDWHIMPTIIAIEVDDFNAAHPAESAVYQLLEGRGYALAGMTGPTLIFKYGK